jgi:hypothetical protein
MGEYAVMAQLLALDWVANVYSPAADYGVDIILLTESGKVRKIQVKTSRFYESGGSWWKASKRSVERDAKDTEMFYTLGEGHPPKDFLVFPSADILRLFQTGFSGTWQDRLIHFTGFKTPSLWVRHSGPNRGGERLRKARAAGETLNKYENRWELLK